MTPPSCDYTPSIVRLTLPNLSFPASTTPPGHALPIASLTRRQHSNNCSSSSPPSQSALSHSAIAIAAKLFGTAGIVGRGMSASCIYMYQLSAWLRMREFTCSRTCPALHPSLPIFFISNRTASNPPLSSSWETPSARSTPMAFRRESMTSVGTTPDISCTVFVSYSLPLKNSCREKGGTQLTGHSRDWFGRDCSSM